jgi:hypothetical protein
MVRLTIIRVMEWHQADRITRTQLTAGPVMLISTDFQQVRYWQIHRTILLLIVTIAMME